MNEDHTLLHEMCCYGEIFPGSVTSADLFRGQYNAYLGDG